MRRGWRIAARALAGLVLMLAVVAVVIDSPIGHRLAADIIAGWAPKSGLRVSVGRIEGSLFGRARLRQVTLFDRQGIFAEVPEASLDWRPLAWLSDELDLREVVLERGRLLRLPDLAPGDPDAPILPGFDVRLDRLEIDNLRVEEGVLGERRRVDLTGHLRIRKGLARLRIDSRLGGKDRLFARLEAEPDRDRFDLKLDYAAPAGGLLAGLTGARDGLEVMAGGKGGWRRWDGAVLAREGQRNLLALKLANRGGQFSALGEARPGRLLSGLAARAAGDVVAVRAGGSLDGRRAELRLDLAGRGLLAEARGKVHLSENRFDAMAVNLRLRDPDLLGGGLRLEGARASAVLDGPFTEMTADSQLRAEVLAIDGVRVERLEAKALARRQDGGWQVPVEAQAARLVTGNPQWDRQLAPLKGRATLNLAGSRLEASDLALGVPGLETRLVLTGDTARGAYGLAGVAAARGWPLPGLGTAHADAKLVLAFGGAKPWNLRMNLAGRMARVDNATLTSLAGDNLRVSGGVSLGAGEPLLIERARLDGSRLTLALSGRRLADGRVQVTGSGRHRQYGPFTAEASLAADGPRATLVLADPLPSAGLRDVRLALSPIAGGFRIETRGGSALGPFTGTLGLFATSGAPTRLEVEQFKVWQTGLTGSLLLGGQGLTGQLRLAGGGLDGEIGLAPRGGGQGFDLRIDAEDARFGGPAPIAIGSGRLEASGSFAAEGSTIAGSAFGQGLAIGSAFIGRLAASLRLDDGRGQVTASLAGRRGSRFALQLRGDIAPGQVAVAAQGDFAGQRITMPRRAVLTREDAGWRLARSQVSFGGGRVIASGLLGGDVTELDLALASLPLAIADAAVPELGFGGTASGTLSWRAPRLGAPSASASLQVRGLTRSGLVLTSRPVDLALVAQLAPESFEARAVVRDGGSASGRVQARIAALPADGTLAERLRRGALSAQLRYDGPADAIWRLVALEEFDLTGPVRIAADAVGSLSDPRITGTLSSTALRLQSALTGIDITGIAARGRFDGSRLVVPSFAGRTANGGQVTGSGSFDLSGLGERAPGLDLRIAALGAQVLARSDMAATVTGPVRIVSDGVQGTIAGRLALNSARWTLGRAAVLEELPDIATREINRRADIAPPRRVHAAWRYLIDARADSRVMVRGLGLDSEWSADIRLRGTTRDPAIEGRADLVRGGYDFAGKRFELTRGRIAFTGSSPPDPRLDIAAEAAEQGVTARVTVTGTSLKPEIRFTSTPPLPEEELLSRLLFGTSITAISAPEALQLGAALAALRSGGGLDPINRLRRAVGLDRLRIVSPDTASGRGTGVAAGKYLGRRFYAEVITDGRGYSASQLEFRVTNWLAILASISSTGREGINVKASKDY